MKGIALLLLCAVALTQADQPQRSRSGKICICHSDEAASTCSKYGYEGYLIVHENCNQFYKCSNSQALPYFCPSNLLYNPITKLCDWPFNVECGHRPIVEEGDCDEESEDNDQNSDSSDNGDSEVPDNDNNEGTCNCNPSEASGICGVDGSNGILIAHEICNQFYKCDHGVPVALNCPSGLLYNPFTEQCDWAHKVECGDRLIVDIDDGGNNGDEEDCSEESNNGNGESGSGSGNQNGTDSGSGPDNGNNGGTCNCNPGEAPDICAADGSNGILIANENCNQFYKCDHGVPLTFNCYNGLLYNPYTEQCDWPENVDCGDKPIVDIGGGNNGESGSGNGNGDNGNGNGNGSDNGSGNGNGTDSGSGPGNGGTCNCNPGEAPGICAVDGSEGTLVAHENCNQFYKCAHGAPVTVSCPAGLVYNPYIECCDWPYNAECGDKPIVDIGGGNNGDNDSGNGNGDNGNGNGNGDNGSGSGNGDSGTGEGTCNCNPGEAPGICAADGSEGTLVAHENCNQFYKCAHGAPVTVSCPAGLVYNAYIECCDWPYNVECGNKPIVDIGGGHNGENGSGNGNGDNGSGNGNGDNGSGNGNGDNDNGDNGTGGGTCNCNPGEAPGICAAYGSGGILIAHENCNQFYKCDHGVPVALNCQNGLLYNPYTEQCDWPENVDCGDKPIVEIGGGNNGDTGSGDGNGDNGNGNGNGDNGSGNGNGDNGTGGGTCNCNPGEAPGICAADGSGGILIAHENCNQFYKCDHGVPVALSCQNGLLYNPYTEQCDWPKNVDCGDKPIVDIGGGNNGDNGGGNGDNGSGNGDNGSGNGNGDNGTGGGTCNCNPGEAPGICAADGSGGILIAHKNCNQFYKCDHGVPVAFNCQNGLLYNPYTEQCDWPENVDCGDKPIVDIGGGNNGGNGSGSGNGDDGSGNENGNNDSGNGNGDNDNGNNGTGGGTCNCNPGEAPGICAADGSGGILIAHENCNQFYKCDHGVPVALNCQNGLLYNPYTEQCDWPENVDCGDKPIVDIGGGNNGDNGSGSGNGDGGSGNGNGDNGSGNGNGDNGDGDNGTGGTCNCNPGEASGICAADGSGGILIAHENCNQFYKCDHGVPVALNCQNGLLYNPYTEQCDWPENVDCGDKPIFEIGGGSNGENGGGNGDSGSGNGNGDNGSGNGDNGSGNGNGDNETGGGTCNCNPGEAPAICATGDSEGVLIAHEECNKFYKCSFGNTVALACPNNLLYNPIIEVCDWPWNVECGERVILEAGGDDGGDNGGDNNDSENGNTGGNCDPSQAPAICAANGSSGVLVANENCDQYYVCSHGAPVALNCPANLLYNPSIEQCDWPRNVDCGDRVVPVPEAESDNGACFCNPRQAPSICASSDSDGKMIAHAACDQYYVCFNGKPIARSCPRSLFYDAQTKQCNWPAAVNCDGRDVATPVSLNKHMQARRGYF